MKQIATGILITIFSGLVMAGVGAYSELSKSIVRIDKLEKDKYRFEDQVINELNRLNDKLDRLIERN